jgi:O-methyltransferase
MAVPPPELRSEEPGVDDTRRLYLDLLKRALTHTLYWPLDQRSRDDYLDPELVLKAVADAVARGDLDLESEQDVRKAREDGRDWPEFAQTMVGLHRLENVQRCVEQVLVEGIPGDLIETGIWRGGVVIFMRALLKAFGDRERVVFAADSFCGLPPPEPKQYPADEGDRLHTADALAVSREDVERNFRLYGLLDDQVRFLPGWFKDTLPGVRDRRWAVVRVDGDMYQSTMDALVNLYPGLSVGGFLIVDDFALDSCRQAVEDYRAEHDIDEPVEAVDWTGVYWRRTH